VETELLQALGQLGAAQERDAAPGELDALSQRVHEALDRLNGLRQAA
jgi:hypothetical protein